MASEQVRVGMLTSEERRLINCLTTAERKETLIATARLKLIVESQEMRKRADELTEAFRPARTMSDEEASQLGGFYCGVDN